jgi:hypothetical protein
MAACKVVTLTDARKTLGVDARVVQAPGSACNYVTKAGAHLRLDVWPSAVKPDEHDGQRITVDGEKAYLVPDPTEAGAPPLTTLVSYRNGKAYVVAVSGTAHDRATAKAALHRALSGAYADGPRGGPRA